MVTLKNVRLSSNPAAQIVQCADGLGGEANCASDGDLYVVVEVEGGQNPFKKNHATVVYRQQNGRWPGETPANLKKMIGNKIPGQFVTVACEPYEIIDARTGEMRAVNTNTIFVQEGQSIEAAARAKGCILVNQETEREAVVQ